MNDLDQLAYDLGVTRTKTITVPCSGCGTVCRPVAPLDCFCIKCYAAQKGAKVKPSTGDDDETDKTPGNITTEFTFWCGLCTGHWERFISEGTKMRTAHVARKAGWRLTKSNGWLCPRHRATTGR